MTMSKRRGKWLSFLIACAAVLLVFAILYPAVRAARRAAQQVQRENMLRQISLGLYNFHDTYKRLPPAIRRDEAGRELCSWRFQILPYLESIMIGIDFSDAWDDPVNRLLSTHPYRAYCWSSDADFPKSLHTSVVAITGPGTAFDRDRSINLADIDSDTIIVVEIADSDTHWMEPGDLHIEKVPNSIVRGLDGTGVLVLFADGAVWFLKADVPVADLKKFFTIEGAKRYDRAQLLGPYVLRQYPRARL